MALTFKSIGRAIGKTVKTLAKPAAIAGLSLINPALGAAAAKAVAVGGAVRSATSSVAGILGKKATSSVTTLAAVQPVVSVMQPSYPEGAVAIGGAMPVLNAPPAEVPAMPWATFRGIMWEAYQKGVRGEVLT